MRHCKLDKAWIAKRSKKVELLYLPSHSPELNSEERLDADTKHAIGSNGAARTKDNLKAAATEHIRSLEQSPERARIYFRDLRVKYAA